MKRKLKRKIKSVQNQQKHNAQRKQFSRQHTDTPIKTQPEKNGPEHPKQPDPKQTGPKTQQKHNQSADAESLAQWQLTEEKKTYSRDREITFVLIGLAGAIIAVLLKTYIFAALLVMATGVFIYTNRQSPKKLTFNITSIGIFLENDFLPSESIKSFNIIDDPGKRARLILKIEKVIQVNEVVPIYDIDIHQIEDALQKLNIPKQKDLNLTTLDKIATNIL